MKATKVPASAASAVVRYIKSRDMDGVDWKYEHGRSGMIVLCRSRHHVKSIRSFVDGYLYCLGEK